MFDRICEQVLAGVGLGALTAALFGVVLVWINPDNAVVMGLTVGSAVVALISGIGLIICGQLCE